MFTAIIPAVRTAAPVVGRIVGRTALYSMCTYSTLVLGALAVDVGTMGAKKAWKGAKAVGKQVRFSRDMIYEIARP